MHMNKRVRGDVCLILCGVLVWFLADAKQLRLEAAGALALCAGTVIPALFPFMAVAGMLVRLGLGQWLAPYMAGLTAPLFRLPGCAGSALLLGLVGGYPIGARTAAELYTSGALTRQEAERLLTFCNNSNPVFLVSVLGSGVFGSVQDGAVAVADPRLLRPTGRSAVPGAGAGTAGDPAARFLSVPRPVRSHCLRREGRRRRDAVRLRLRDPFLCAGIPALPVRHSHGRAGCGNHGAVFPDAPADL